ncbi:MAG: Pirin [Fluviibacter phosphoraccumulans EoVTN8]
MLIKRPANERGHADHGWLRSFHSFSFADYFDRNHMHFGPLRVINEDWVAAGTGFGMHPHKDMEIVTYILEGELTHQDSMGHQEVIRPNEVQRMSAGTGVFHSEFNCHSTNTCYLLQIWIMPDQKDLSPEYEQTAFDPAEKRGKLRLVAAPDGAHGAVTIHKDARLYAGLFDGAENATHPLPTHRMAYVHVTRGSITVNGEALSAGDTLMLRDETVVRLSNGNKAEVLVFDLPCQ